MISYSYSQHLIRPHARGADVTATGRPQAVHQSPSSANKQLRWHAQAAATQGLTDTLRAAIVDHRNSWITEADFAKLAGAGINAVRVPVGYWVLATTQVSAVA